MVLGFFYLLLKCIEFMEWVRKCLKYDQMAESLCGIWTGGLQAKYQLKHHWTARPYSRVWPIIKTSFVSIVRNFRNYSICYDCIIFRRRVQSKSKVILIEWTVATHLVILTEMICQNRNMGRRVTTPWSFLSMEILINIHNFIIRCERSAKKEGEISLRNCNSRKICFDFIRWQIRMLIWLHWMNMYVNINCMSEGVYFL